MQTVAYLMPFAKPLIYVDSSASIGIVQAKMIGKEVSHIPIIDGERKNVGLVKRKKIWLWMLNNKGKSPVVQDVKEGPLPEVQQDEPLASAMKKLDDSSALLIRGKDKRYTHFLSPKVVSNALQCYSERFQIVEQLEHSIRNRLQLIPLKELAEEFDLEEADLDKMTFACYHKAFSKFWDQLELAFLDRKTVLGLLESVREYRNAVMHFRLTDGDGNIDAAKELQKLLD